MKKTWKTQKEEGRERRRYLEKGERKKQYKGENSDDYRSELVTSHIGTNFMVVVQSVLSVINHVSVDLIMI